MTWGWCVRNFMAINLSFVDISLKTTFGNLLVGFEGEIRGSPLSLVRNVSISISSDVFHRSLVIWFCLHLKKHLSLSVQYLFMMNLLSSARPSLTHWMWSAGISLSLDVSNTAISWTSSLVLFSKSPLLQKHQPLSWKPTHWKGQVLMKIWILPSHGRHHSHISFTVFL